MQNYAITWTDEAGTPRASAVAYTETGAAKRKTELETAGCGSVTVVPVKPGQLPDAAV